MSARVCNNIRGSDLPESFIQNWPSIMGTHVGTYYHGVEPKINDTLMLTSNEPNTYGLVIMETIRCAVVVLANLKRGGGSEGALIVKSMDPCGCTKGVLIVLWGYKIDIRYMYYLF